jgi:hypothetical protein
MIQDFDIRSLSISKCLCDDSVVEATYNAFIFEFIIEKSMNPSKSSYLFVNSLYYSSDWISLFFSAIVLVNKFE